MPNNIGAFGENFPYTNFHDMNQDWLIKTMKETTNKTEELNTRVTECETIVDNMEEEIPGIIEEAVAEQVPGYIEYQLNHGGYDLILAQSRKRRLVMIGDSYGAGWTPDGDVTGYPNIVQNWLHIANADFFQANKGGARFGADENSEYAFDTVLNGLLSSITDKDSITDIIFAGGYNEGASTTTSINNGITRCKHIIEDYFHNPSLKVHLFSIGYSSVSPAQRELLSYRYKYCYANSGWGYVNLTPCICNQQLWASDGYHPLQIAQDRIATNIINILNGGTITGKTDATEFAQTSKTGITFYTNILNDYFDSFLYGQNIGFSEAITLNKDTAVKILEITSDLPLCNTNDNSKLLKYNIPAIIEQNGNVYKNVNLIMFIKQENRTTYGLYASVFMVNSAGNNYESFSNVTAIQIQTNAMHIIIPFMF